MAGFQLKSSLLFDTSNDFLIVSVTSFILTEDSVMFTLETKVPIRVKEETPGCACLCICNRHVGSVLFHSMITLLSQLEDS